MKNYSTKRALIASILMLALCCSMLLGTTYAWFTDSVTSSNNIIKTGKLDVAMYWAEGDEDPNAVSAWNEVNGAIFNNDKWEPGYSEAKHIKIANEGTLALQYQMRIIADGVVSTLAEVIDVYCFTDAKQLTRADFVEANKLGTLTEVLNVTYADNISNTIKGNLEAGKSKTVTLAFKMREDAGNEYQNLSIGSGFSIQILATQYTSEYDSFDNQYDADADFAPQEIPSAMVYQLGQNKLQNITIAGLGATLDTGYSFQPTETFEQASAGEYEWAHADFFVYADATVPANSMALAGYYTAFDGFSWGGETCTSTTWIGLTADTDIAAGEANGIRLLGDGMGLPGISYSEICNYGNDGTGFLCGATDLTGANEGTTLYVELRVYKIECQGTCGGHHNSFDCESGEYITIGKFQYTFDDPNVEYLADGSRVEYGENGEVTLEGVDKATVTNGTYYIPDGVTSINGEVFTQNADITTVVIPDTITDFGATGVSDTNASSGAFKNSAVETVVLPEGMTEIPAAAFNGAKNLKSVNIPSTVETIGVNAFRSTAITELTVPATVETISYGAFRDMTSLTTVTIEGDVHIPNYAFRGCTNLRTVYINGENATVGSNMAFCNASSNNPGTNDLTFYVKNVAVAVQVKTCMGVGSDYHIYVGSDLVYSCVGNPQEVTVNKLKGVKTLDELQSAINNAADGDIIYLTANITGDVTIDTGIATTIDGANYEYAGSIKIRVGETVTIQNVNFVHTGSTAYDFIKNEGSPTGKNYNTNLLVENCTFVGDGNNGTVAVRTIHPTHVQINNCSGEKLHSFLQNTGGQKVTVNNLTVTDSKSGISVGSPKSATVSNCNFNVGEGYGIRIDAATADSAFIIESCKISAYIPVAVRKATANNVSLTFDGSSTMTETNTEGLWCAVANNEYGDVLKADLTAGTYAVNITVNDAGLDQNGLYVKN